MANVVIKAVLLDMDATGDMMARWSDWYHQQCCIMTLSCMVLPATCIWHPPKDQPPLILSNLHPDLIILQPLICWLPVALCLSIADNIAPDLTQCSLQMLANSSPRYTLHRYSVMSKQPILRFSCILIDYV